MMHGRKNIKKPILCSSQTKKRKNQSPVFASVHHALCCETRAIYAEVRFVI